MRRPLFIVLLFIGGVRGRAETWTDSRVHQLPDYFGLSTAVLEDHRLAVISAGHISFSADDRKPLTAGLPLAPVGLTREGRPGAGPLLKTSRGVLIMVYGDPTTRKLSWDRVSGEPKSDLRADVWVIRSLDGGRTWTDRQMISAPFKALSPYALSIIQLAEAPDGTVVVPIQLRMSNHNRNAVTSIVSRDQGKTWLPGHTVLDIGGAGIHDGLLEPTLVALRDGRMWMLLRTTLDVFYQSFSSDSGMSWSAPTPTSIGASSSPGYLLRLTSGRLLLVWNQLYPEGKTEYPRRSGKGFSLRPASWHRDELSIAFSTDEGRTWSRPTVAVRAMGDASYPSALERRPGEVWISTHYRGQATYRFQEADFTAGDRGGNGQDRS